MYYRYVKIATALIAFLTLFSSHFARSENASQRSDLDLAIDFYSKNNFVESKAILVSLEDCCNGEALYYLAKVLEREQQAIDETVFELYNRSSDLGFAQSMREIAKMYQYGKGGLVKNVLLATDWERRAGQSEIKNISTAYVVNEKGEEINVIAHWQSQAEQGSLEALYRLARIYDDGLYTPRDTGLAAKYYIDAATLGHKESMYLAGYLYCRGIGVKKSVKSANEWLSAYEKGLICH
jgi:TPR repeat protein